MKKAVYLLLLIVLGAIFQYFFSWWTLPLLAALLAVGLGLSPGQSLVLGFLGAGLLWGGYAAYINVLNEGLLAARMGGLFDGLGPGTMVFMTAFFGGFFGGLGALTGSLAGQAFFSSDKFAARA